MTPAELLRLRHRAWKVYDPLWLCRTIGDPPHAGQVPILADLHRLKVICCGTRWGKSWTAGRWAASKLLPPETRGWCTSGTYDLADKVYREIVGIFQRHGAKLGVTVVKASSTPNTQQTLLLSNGSWVATKSADHPDSLDAEGLDFAVDDEAAKHPSKILWQHLMPRLTDRRGELLAISTARGRNWYYDVHQDALDCLRTGRDPAWAAFSAPSSGNPHVFPLGDKDPEWLRLRSQYERARMLPLFEQEYGGSFAHLQGRIWQGWDPRRHVAKLDRVKAGVREWRLIVDWGTRNPCGMVVMGRTEDKQIRIVDEWYETGKTLDQIAAQALVFKKRWGCSQGWADPSEPGQILYLNNAGFHLVGANNDWHFGVLSVADAMAEDGGFLIAEGRCPNLEREIENYHHREVPHGAPEAPAKENDHLCDCTRYGVVGWNAMDGAGTTAGRYSISEPKETREMYWRRRFAQGKQVGDA